MEERMYGQVNMMYACITVLRALALLDGPQNIWKDYTKFESHLEERMKTEVYTKVNMLLRPLQVVAFLKVQNSQSRKSVRDAKSLQQHGCTPTKKYKLLNDTQKKGTWHIKS